MAIAVLLVTAGGKPLPAAYGLVSAEVVREVGRIPHARLLLAGGDLPKRRFPALDDDALAPGRPVTIAVRVDEATTELFAGQVARLRLELQGGAPRLGVELKDAAWRLVRVPRSAIYPDGTDADAVAAVLARAKVKAGTIEGAEVRHPALVQYDATDWDFILARAAANGCAVTVKDGAVSMRPWSVAGPAALTLDIGVDPVADLELELDATGQPETVEAAGWDLAAGTLTDPAAAAAFALAQGDVDPAAAAAALTPGTARLAHLAALPPAELRALASGRLARARLAMLRGRVRIGGRAVELLDLVALKGVGKRFTGSAPVGGVRHVVAANAWTTDLELGLPAPPSAPPPSPPARALTVGIVQAAEEDPLGERRIPVLLPGLTAGGDASGVVRARLASPQAGKERGAAFRPQEGDEVVVGFVANDPREPVVLGALFGSRNPPYAPFAAADADAPRGFGSAAASIEMVEGTDKASVLLRAKGSSVTIALADGAESIALADANGNELVLDKAGIRLSSAKDLVLDAGSGKVAVTGGSIALN